MAKINSSLLNFCPNHKLLLLHQLHIVDASKSRDFALSTEYEEPAKKAPFDINKDDLKMVSNEERIAVSAK